MYKKLAQMPDSPEKDEAEQKLRKLLEESQKGEDADEEKVEELLKGVVSVLPDVAEITINTLINPASGLTSLIQVIAKRVSGGMGDD